MSNIVQKVKSLNWKKVQKQHEGGKVRKKDRVCVCGHGSGPGPSKKKKTLKNKNIKVSFPSWSYTIYMLSQFLFSLWKGYNYWTLPLLHQIENRAFFFINSYSREMNWVYFCVSALWDVGMGFLLSVKGARDFKFRFGSWFRIH